MLDSDDYETGYMLKDNIGFEYIVDSCAYCKCDFYNGGNEHYV